MIDAPRYLIRHLSSGRLLAWSYDPTRALRCAESMWREQHIPCFVETLK